MSVLCSKIYTTVSNALQRKSIGFSSHSIVPLEARLSMPLSLIAETGCIELAAKDRTFSERHIWVLARIFLVARKADLEV